MRSLNTTRYSLIALVASAILVPSCSEETKSTSPPVTVKNYSIEQLYNNQSVNGADFNADESRVLVAHNRTGIFNVYEIAIGDTALIPLTKSTKDSYFAVDYLPGNSNKFIYAADKGGDENSHLYLATKNGEEAKDLTPWNGSANEFFGWSEDKKFLYVLSNKRNPKYFDLWKLDTSSWKPTLIYKDDTGLSITSVSSTERYITLSKSITTDRNELYLVDTKNKKTTRLSNENESSWQSTGFEKNDSTLYYITNDNSEFNYLVKYNIPTGKSEKMYEDKWDVGFMSLSENEKYRTVFVNADGKNKVLLFDHKSGKEVKFPDFNDGDVLSVKVSDSEKKMLFTVGSSTSPKDLYVYDLATNDIKRITSTLNPAINRDDLVKAEVVRFKSFDGTEIPAIYYKPKQASADNRVPALVWVHGGPGGQSRIGYSNSIQHLVNNGYAVLAVNNRGSSGYGKTFYKMDNKDHSNGDLKDCVWAKKWLSSQNYIDSSCIGIYGGSYGGCMVLTGLAFHPREFKVGVDLFGVTNWPRTLKSIPPYWEAFRAALYNELGDPYSADSVRLKQISPLYNYEKITNPLLVFQGANDVRVLPVESNEIVEGVKKNGVPVEYVVYEDEGHGFVKKENQIKTAEKTLAFLDKYLKPTRDTVKVKKEAM